MPLRKPKKRPIKSKTAPAKPPVPPTPSVLWLRQNGLRATQERNKIVRLLHRDSAPQTLAEIHRKVRIEGCNYVTVFRFMSVLEQKNLVDKLTWPDGSIRYELRTGTHHHHYLICRTCQKAQPLPDCFLESFQEKIGQESGFIELSHSLQLSGLCPPCQKRRLPRKKRSGKVETIGVGLISPPHVDPA